MSHDHIADKSTSLYLSYVTRPEHDAKMATLYDATIGH